VSLSLRFTCPTTQPATAGATHAKEACWTRGLGRRCVYVRRSRCTRGITRPRKGLFAAGVASVNAERSGRIRRARFTSIINGLPVAEKRAEVAFYRGIAILPSYYRSTGSCVSSKTRRYFPRGPWLGSLALSSLSRTDGRWSNLRGAQHPEGRLRPSALATRGTLKHG